LRKSVTKAEAEIERLSKNIAVIESALADGTLYAGDAARAQALARERGELIRAREDAEAAWLEASEAYEAAAVQKTRLFEPALRPGGSLVNMRQ
jgi:ATP-binding cassette subfamily F protein 3